MPIHVQPCRTPTLHRVLHTLDPSSVRWGHARIHSEGFGGGCEPVPTQSIVSVPHQLCKRAWALARKWTHLYSKPLPTIRRQTSVSLPETHSSGEGDVTFATVSRVRRTMCMYMMCAVWVLSTFRRLYYQTSWRTYSPPTIRPPEGTRNTIHHGIHIFQNIELTLL